MSASQRLLAVADILGFRHRVTTWPVERVVDHSLVYLRRALNFAIHRSTDPQPPSLDDLNRHSSLGLAWFSDTVLIFARDDKDETASTFIETIGYLAFVTTFPSDARMRVGIDHGELYVDEPNRIYVGKGLVAAYDLQAEQEWSGGALTAAAAKRVVSLRGKSYVVSYPVPGKKGICSDTAVAWTNGIHFPTSFEWSKGKFEPSLEEEHGQPNIALKWRNTRRFHEECCEVCKANRR